jgi:hypothetical protein
MTSPERLDDLALRVEQFHGVTLERVLGEIEYLRDAGDTVIAGGSLAYGLGNNLSDLDLVVCGPATAGSSWAPLEHFVGSLRVDVWKLGQGSIEGSFARAEQALASEGALLGAFGDIDHEDEFRLLHRIAYGLVLDGGGLELSGVRSDRQRLASELVMREYAERMRAAALVAQLSLRVGLSVAAVVNARLAIENALNAAVAQRGFPFSGDKWLGERLDKEVPELAGLYQPFRRLPSNPIHEGAGFVKAALQACEEIWELELALDALAALARWDHAEDVRLAAIGADHLLLAPRSGAIWELDGSEANAWRRLGVAGDGRQDEGWTVANCDPEALALCVHLHERGLLNLSWIEGVPIKASGVERKAEA